MVDPDFSIFGRLSIPAIPGLPASGLRHETQFLRRAYPTLPFSSILVEDHESDVLLVTDL